MSNGLATGKQKIVFDNLFSSPELMKYLLSKGIYRVATLRANRNHNCPIPAEKDMKKQGRDAMTEVVDTEQKVVVCPWYDNRRVLTIFNFVGITPNWWVQSLWQSTEQDADNEPSYFSGFSQPVYGRCR